MLKLTIRSLVFTAKEIEDYLESKWSDAAEVVTESDWENFDDLLGWFEYSVNNLRIAADGVLLNARACSELIDRNIQRCKAAYAIRARGNEGAC